MTDSSAQPGNWQQGGRRWLITLVVAAAVALSWSGIADQHAHEQTSATFKKALAAAALARAFNGVISVAQGTEVAIQPVGVGVTLTVGEILDPLNDLVERFAVLALAASVSLGLQMTVGDMVTSVWLNGALSISALACLALLWLPGAATSVVAASLRVLAAVVFLRFLLVVVLLVTNLLNTMFLDQQQDTAMAQLSATSSDIEQLQHNSADNRRAAESEDFFDRTSAQLKNLLDNSAQALDLQDQLAQLQARVEDSVEDIIRLIVIFLLQTLVLPLATVWLCWQLFRGFWRRIRPKTSV